VAGAESCRKHKERLRARARIEWRLHHAGQAQKLRRTLESLVAYHEARAEEYRTFNLLKGAA